MVGEQRFDEGGRQLDAEVRSGIEGIGVKDGDERIDTGGGQDMGGDDEFIKEVFGVFGGGEDRVFGDGDGLSFGEVNEVSLFTGRGFTRDVGGRKGDLPGVSADGEDVTCEVEGEGVIYRGVVIKDV